MPEETSATPLFGDAVHQILNLIQHRNPLLRDISIERFDEILQANISAEEANRFRQTTYTDLQKKLIVKCWRYLNNLAGFLGNLCIERTMHNGKKPDLIGRYLDWLYLIEVKTFVLNKKDFTKLQKSIDLQIRTPLRYLRKRAVRPEFVRGYVCFFLDDPTSDFKVVWVEVLDHGPPLCLGPGRAQIYQAGLGFRRCEPPLPV